MFDILTPSQMSKAEQASVELGVSLAELMDNAGEQLGREVLGETVKRMAKSIVILIGSGNNGGDGSVCADFLLKSGISPSVVLMCGKPKTELALNAFERIDGRCVVMECSDERYSGLIESADIIVDCVFGTGFRGEIKDNMMPFLSMVNGSSAYKIACDVPSGANCLNGHTSAGTLRCSKTVTFHRPKLGMSLSPAKELCGEVKVKDIGIPSGWEQYVGYSVEQPALEMIKAMLPPRPRNSHKGTYGRLMLVCGSGKYMGAAFISTKAALRSGVGIARLCTIKDIVMSFVSAMPECVYTAVSAAEGGYISKGNIDELVRLSASADAVVIGCGIGVSDDTKEIVYELIKKVSCPVIVDADGINCLSEHIDILKEKRSEIILTPHPAELARLCRVDVADVLSDRLGYALQLAEKYKVTVHAKSAQSMTVTPDGKCYITDYGNTALAKGGSGDMLVGLIGSFTAQGVKPEGACILASCLMGSTAQLLSEKKSQRGIVATDIIDALPDMLITWE